MSLFQSRKGVLPGFGYVLSYFAVTIEPYTMIPLEFQSARFDYLLRHNIWWLMPNPVGSRCLVNIDTRPSDDFAKDS